MPRLNTAANTLRSFHKTLGAYSPAICQYELADRAREADLRGGRILRPYVSQPSVHIPYSAATPVAEHIGGARQVTLEGAALRGASMAVAFLRTDFLVAGSFACAFWTPSSLFRAAAGSVGRSVPLALRGTLPAAALVPSLPTLLLVAAGFGWWEGLLGSGTRDEFHAKQAEMAARHGKTIPPAEIARREGGIGGVESALMDFAASARLRGQTAYEVAALSAAVGVRLAAFPLRAATAGLVGSVALVGAAAGALYAGASNAAFALRLQMTSPGEAVVFSMREAQLMQQRRPGLRALNEEYEPGIALALWTNRIFPQRGFNNQWTQWAVNVSAFLCVHGILAANAQRSLPRNPGEPIQLELWEFCLLTFHLVSQWFTLANNWSGLFGRRFRPDLPQRFAPGRAVPGRAVPGRRQHPAPFVPDLEQQHRRGVDIHERGRDPAMRESLTHLLERYPHVPVEQRIRELLAGISDRERQGSPLNQRLHPSRAWTVIQAAKHVLGVRVGLRRAAPGILNNPQQLYITLDPDNLVPLKTVLATVVHAIGQLEDPRGRAFDADLRQERTDALIVALADCLDEYESLVCDAGQAQRILLVLQGCVPEVQIENLDATPTVAAFVAGAYRHIARDLPEDAPAANVRARFHAAYADGTRVLPAEQHARLQTELTNLLQIDHDLAWSA